MSDPLPFVRSFVQCPVSDPLSNVQCTATRVASEEGTLVPCLGLDEKLLKKLNKNGFMMTKFLRLKTNCHENVFICPKRFCLFFFVLRQNNRGLNPLILKNFSFENYYKTILPLLINLSYCSRNCYLYMKRKRTNIQLF